MNRESHGNQFRPGKEKTGGSRFHLKVCLDLQVKITEKFHFLFRSVQEISGKPLCFSAVMSCRKVRRSKKSCKERQDRIRTKVQRVFLSDPSVKEKRKAGEDREDFHPEHSGEGKIFTQVKHRKEKRKLVQEK